MRGTMAALMFGILLTTGCASTQQPAMNDQSYNAPVSIYSAMDSTSLVYTDPAAAAPVGDNPYRWMGFILHPVGQFFDYTVNRPLYTLSSINPRLFGYTSEDAMVDSQRR
ncbi:MAG: hypothetical protein KF814_15585 [Nitrospiraceae bacterium]|nr:hypothetical protein [Nitrospiraceae bacterium]